MIDVIAESQKRRFPRQKPLFSERKTAVFDVKKRRLIFINRRFPKQFHNYHYLVFGKGRYGIWIVIREVMKTIKFLKRLISLANSFAGSGNICNFAPCLE